MSISDPPGRREAFVDYAIDTAECRKRLRSDVAFACWLRRHRIEEEAPEDDLAALVMLGGLPWPTRCSSCRACSASTS